MTTAMSSKRKLTFLTMEQKHDVNIRMDRGEPATAIMARYGVSRATVFNIRRNRENIAKYVVDNPAQVVHRSTVSNRHFFVRIEDKLYDWYVEQKFLRGGPVTDETLVERALNIYRHEVLFDGNSVSGGGVPFTASGSWLEAFKKKYKIVEEPATEEDVPEIWTAEEFAEKVKQLGLKAQQVYVAEPSRMQWSSLPGDRRLGDEGTDDSETTSSDWLTFVPCANVSGTHKLDLLVIVDSQGSSSTNVMDIRGARLSVRVVYTNNVKGEGQPMTVAGAFCQWFTDHFVPSVQNFQRVSPKPRTVLLAVTDVDFVAHRDRLRFFGPKASRVDVIVAFIISSGIRQVAWSLQAEYRMLLLSLALQYDRTTVRDVVRLLARAWQSIPNEAILCAWRWTWADVKADVVASLYRERCGNRPDKDEILRWLQAPTLGDDCGPPPGIPINTNDDVIDNDNAGGSYCT